MPFTIVMLPVTLDPPTAVAEIVPAPVVVTSWALCSIVPPTSTMSPAEVLVIAWLIVSR